MYYTKIHFTIHVASEFDHPAAGVRLRVCVSKAISVYL